MITRQYALNQKPRYPFEHNYELGSIVFFDIETTGLSADSSYLYLIGCSYYKDSSYQLIQWFSEGIKEEPLLLTTFFEFIASYRVLIHFNGSGFDIPYLQKKCNLLQLEYSFHDIISIDIYKKILPYKKLLKLSSLKLKSLEVFLNIHRKDIYTGGELIPVYQSYLGKKHLENLKKRRNPETKLIAPSESDKLLQQLLLHNEEDIIGLFYISPILSYVDLFEKTFRILQAGVNQDLLSIDFEISSNLPVRIAYSNDLIALTAYENTATLTIHIYEGELKHFYENYKDYYYLPAEDYAIHKSLAQFVDKDYREKAKPANCYLKKEGIFAPQYEPVITPFFKMSLQDKLSFAEVHTDFLLQEENLELYVKHILSHIMSK